MSSAPALTLAYLEQAPAAAAKVLQEAGIAEAAVFLEEVPARLAGPVVNSMIPAMGARCLERLAPAAAAGMLRNLPYHDAATLLRLVRIDLREGILAELPTSTAKRMHRSLQYSLGSVGAWIDPDVPLLSPEHSVDDALRYLRDTRSVSHIFLESASSGRFLGAVSVNELLRSDRAAPLQQLPVEKVVPISNRAALSSVAFHEAWDEYLMLPVVGHRHNVLGGLSRVALRRAVHEHHARVAAAPSSIAGTLGSALVLTCGALARLVINSTAAAPAGRRS